MSSLLVTVRNNSCGKVMFSEAPVILSKGGECTCLLYMPQADTLPPAAVNTLTHLLFPRLAAFIKASSIQCLSFTALVSSKAFRRIREPKKTAPRMRCFLDHVRFLHTNQLSALWCHPLCREGTNVLLNLDRHAITIISIRYALLSGISSTMKQSTSSI